MVGSCSSGQAIRAVQTGRVAWLHTPALHFTLDSPERRKPSRQRNLPTKLSGPEPGAASIHPFSRVGVKHSSNARLREGSRTASVQVLMMASSFFWGVASFLPFLSFLSDCSLRCLNHNWVESFGGLVGGLCTSARDGIWSSAAQQTHIVTSRH